MGLRHLLHFLKSKPSLFLFGGSRDVCLRLCCFELEQTKVCSLVWPVDTGIGFWVANDGMHS